MPKDQVVGVSREAVGIFHTPEALQDAIDELLSSGFHRAELGLLASETVVIEKLGHRYSTIATLADDPATPRAAYVGNEDIGNAEGGIVGGLVYVGATLAAGAVVASGGTLLAVIAGAAVAGGAGGMIGSVLAQWIGDRHASHLQEQIEKGGLLLWVRTRDAAKEKRAVRILEQHSADKVHVHDLSMKTQQA
ncbi:MAG: hypothetical protein K0S54_2468 [Alphaproteobacteria bacterium]|jgi:hypothetical protein|nr:hypothetical protein [Alphaproteobacteria bacterium]